MDEKKQSLLKAAAENGETLSEENATNQSYQIAFPTLVRSTFHPVFSGIMIAAIIAAVMSSADSCLSSLSTVVMEDTYRRHIHPQATDRQLLAVAQGSTLVLGVAAAVCALFFSDIADILEFVYDFWAPTMVLPFLVAVFWYRESRIYAVVVSMFAGLFAVIVWRFVLDSPYDIGPALFGFGFAVIVFLVAWPLTCRWPVAPLCQPGKA
jgi:Na+/proline symporter